MPSPPETNCRSRKVVPPSVDRSSAQSHSHPRATRHQELERVGLGVEGVRLKTSDELGAVQMVEAVVAVAVGNGVDVVGDGDVAAVLIAAADMPFG